ncbi:MAG: hypothetical protein H7Z40_13460 [Phycisphaerae bacterium]|nr:hypothetical protein [Gemmatimonadaceae bacterium]
MDPTQSIAILGVGHCLPDTVRENSDPIFDYIRAHPGSNSDIFAGLKTRRVLGPGESVTTIMVTAAQNALKNANLQPANIDMLLGAASLGEYHAPNALSAVHAALGLSANCRAMAFNTEYTTFLDAMKIANDLITAGTIRNALVVVGMNWTRHMNYTEAVCVAASDAAGAAVVGQCSDASKFRLVDWENETDSSRYSAFRMAHRPASTNATEPPLFTGPTMKIDDLIGRNAIMEFGVPAPPRVVARMLQRNAIASSDITLVPHQVAQLIADSWNKAIAPALYVTTHEDLADMVSASVPVNLSIYWDKIPTNHIVLVGIGMEMHATALLYSRTPATPAS